MKVRLESSAALIDEADQALQKCSRAVNTAEGRALASAVNVIRGELHHATIDRLDAFLGQMRDWERQQARGKKPSQTPEGLLSLAITGWLLGSPSAEAMPQVAVTLWKTRQMVLEYLQENDAPTRQRILADYERTIPSRVELEEVAQMIEHLPPVEAVTVTPGETVQRQAGRGRNLTTYVLRLPPEYSPSKQYPVLIVLSKGGQENLEKPEAMIDRWASAAAEHGYILAAPQWASGIGGGTYGYTEREHDTVLDTLRDLRRRFQIDSDRVFLFGLGEGGKMCFDVGLAHPHLFAGILPMGAGPNFFPRRYWRNAQYLPVYAVNGTRAGESNTLLREQFEHWAIRGYPTLWVEYKGRGIEWLGGEVPNMFDWMRNQRRFFPMRQLGTDGVGTAFGNEFCTMRPEDNRFYWLSTNSINPRYTLKAGRWNNLTEPAAMTARIDPQTNDIAIKTQGLGQISIWFGRNPKGQYMIDFDKPVSVRVGFRFYVNKRKVIPSLAVLLEDLYARGDRKHLFVAHIDLTLR
jgi:pimeloyl-ACP methyl ester carboxylesterase